MADYELPNSVRILLTVLMVVSFLPQLRTLRSTKDSTGISLSYVLINLLVATEHFTIFILVTAVHDPGSRLTHEPLSTGDWLNFTHVTVQWLMFQILFVLCLYYSPSHSRRTYINIYVFFIIIAMFPIVQDLTIGMDQIGKIEGVTIITGLVFGHELVVKPLITVLGFVAFFCQARQTRGGGSPAVSLPGLVIQAVLFRVIAVLWRWRVVWMDFSDDTTNVLPIWLMRYLDYGWLVVDDTILSFAQGWLFVLAVYRSGCGKELKEGTEEAEPFLD